MKIVISFGFFILLLLAATTASAETRPRVYTTKLSRGELVCEKGPGRYADYRSLQEKILALRIGLNRNGGRMIASLSDDNSSNDEGNDFTEETLNGKLFVGAEGDAPGTLIFRSVKSFPAAMQYDEERCDANLSLHLGAESRAHRRPASLLLQYVCRDLVSTLPAGDVNIRTTVENEKCRVRYRGTVKLRR